MTAEDVLIEQIVKDVMRRLDSSAGNASGSSSPTRQKNGTVSCTEKIITRDLLEEIWKTGSQLAIGESSLITPSARDFLNEHAVVVVRGTDSLVKSAKSNWRVVVHEPFTQLAQEWSDFEVHTSTCFEESLQHFQQLQSQSDTNAVFVVENPEVVVCKANRENSIRACHIADASRLETIWKQLKPNLICISPDSFSDYQLKSVIRKIIALDTSSAERVTR